MALTECGAVSIDREGRELIAHGTTLFPVACYHDNVSETKVPLHWHDELEILVVESGTARILANGTRLMVKPGEGCFVNAGILHGAWPEGAEPCRLRSVVFHPRFVGGSVDSILWQKYLQPLLAGKSCPYVYFNGGQEWEKDASRLIEEAWGTCVSEAEGFEFQVREQLSKLIFLLAQNCPVTEKEVAEKTLRDGERVKIMLQYIQDHYGGEVALAQIAGSVNLSENECLRCFRSMTGSTPIQYVKQVRIQRAVELLLTTDQKISEIGAACGFQEMSYFAKTFRSVKGCTPSVFRQCGGKLDRA